VTPKRAEDGFRSTRLCPENGIKRRGAIVIASTLLIMLVTSELVHAQQWCDELLQTCTKLPPVDAGSNSGSYPPGGNFAVAPPFNPPNLTDANLRQTVDTELQSLRVNADIPGVPICQASCTSSITAASVASADGGNARGTEPVLGSGEFSMEETDLHYAGFGVPYTFTRYYRSGITMLTPLGAGWTHSLSRRLIEHPADNCQGAYPDVDYVSEKMERIRFHYRRMDPGNI